MATSTRPRGTMGVVDECHVPVAKYPYRAILRSSDMSVVEQSRVASALRPTLPVGKVAGRQAIAGVTMAVIVTAVVTLIADLVGVVSPLIVAVVAGVALANVGLVPVRAEVGLGLTAKRGLRVAVVLMGARLSFAQLVSGGVARLATVVGIAVASLVGIQWLARRLGLGRDLGLLIATGSSICGASAIAAMSEVVDADETDVAYSMGLVTALGSLAILVLPLLGNLLGLSDVAFGAWSGISVHDVGQVIATASTRGDAAVATATIVKLVRVMMLAPLLVFVRWRSGAARPSAGNATVVQRFLALVPLFIIGFLSMIALRSSGVVPTAWVAGAGTVEGWLMTAALFGLGTKVRFGELGRLGGGGLVVASLGFAVLGIVGLVASPLLAAG